MCPCEVQAPAERGRGPWGAPAPAAPPAPAALGPVCGARGFSFLSERLQPLPGGFLLPRCLLPFRQGVGLPALREASAGQQLAADGRGSPRGRGEAAPSVSQAGTGGGEGPGPYCGPGLRGGNPGGRGTMRARAAGGSGTPEQDSPRAIHPGSRGLGLLARIPFMQDNLRVRYDTLSDSLSVIFKYFLYYILSVFSSDRCPFKDICVTICSFINCE